MWYGVALRELDRTFQARTFIYIGMSLYSTRSWTSELSSCWDRSLSGLVKQELMFLWFCVIHKLGGLPHKKDGGFRFQFWKEPERGRYQDPVMWARLEIFSTFMRYQFLNNILTDTFIIINSNNNWTCNKIKIGARWAYESTPIYK